MADALSFAHANNVVHRDIKPANLMTMKGDARVLDFGVAGVLDPDGKRFTRTSDALAGDVFSAPELTETPKLLDPRCDIYSLGASWFWLLTGTSPKGLNFESRLRASVRMTQDYERVILRCLEQQERRYSSAQELVDDLRRLQRGESPSSSPHDLNDDEARVLGVVLAAYPTGLEDVRLFGIEQELGRRLSRLRTSVALRTLVGRKMIDGTEQDRGSYETCMAYRPLDGGRDWIEKNLLRVEALLEPTKETSPTESSDDDIPF